jgi:hypothetical protein
LVDIPKRVGQREIPEVDLTLASPIEGVKGLKGKGTFDPNNSRISFNVSLLGGDYETVNIHGAGKRANRVIFSVKYKDASLWRDDAGEIGAAFDRTFAVEAEEKARETFTSLVIKAKRNHSPEDPAQVPGAFEPTPLR